MGMHVIILLVGWLGSAAAARAQSAPPADRGPIESLTVPRQMAPAGPAGEDALSGDLARKRQQRLEREAKDRPQALSPQRHLAENLRKESLVPHTRDLGVECSLVGPLAATKGDRASYSTEPTSHFQVFWRAGGAQADGRIGPWYGFRLAPFAGTGVYKQRPGSFGLTYFGPMVGVGKLDPVAKAVAQPGRKGLQGGTTAATVEPGRSSGWVFGTGLAAVSRQGAGDASDDHGRGNDFASKGVTTDATGFWMEGRGISILWGAVSFDAFLGLQTGVGKVFYYAGFGVGGWR